MNNFINLNNIKIDIDKIENEFTREKNVSLSILRLDKIHPEVSGNKIFKLHYFLEEALLTGTKIITFGGAYSNHLAATARACKALNIYCTGVVRGEEPKKFSHTLQFCKAQGMHLKFLSREEYNRKNDDAFKAVLKNEFEDCILIPEGGFSKEGMLGASLISNFYMAGNYSHICCAVGTATTFAGLIKSSSSLQKIVGVSAIKNLNDVEERLEFLLTNSLTKNFILFNEYHFGGFAKKTNELITFMNNFYTGFKIPTDFVYTAKMMFGVFDLIKKNYFNEGSKILCIHTGGLQGNYSLPAGTLIF